MYNNTFLERSVGEFGLNLGENVASLIHIKHSIPIKRLVKVE